ncbi:MAG TPA: translational GTPase TypA [Candidatus Avidehalobacter gallistercoris]|uniref:Large ribosomal subunit assembly factor BipA n=1 Tax=Candidatus Avidehalobacter gallistercoris TaxID=2840694 RepID=A0A9D1KZZ9_9FIRM|nr:translational GTPase TypA [Candidatus Avidehalobacter gallistercoris]
MQREDLRNIAIIAHVDHGKTTLVDQLLKQSDTFRANQTVQDRVMDSNDLERERGITILAKNTSAIYKGVKINIVDTPGHADFGGEVERVLKMVNGVLLLVDAFEGPMPQTRFVLQKALELNLRVIVAINKIDRPDARPGEIVDEVLELFMELDASDEQMDSPFIFCSARTGIAGTDWNNPADNMQPLLDTILDYIPAPTGDASGDLQVLVSSIDYNDYVGRIAVGRIERGEIKQNQEIVLCDYHDKTINQRAKVTAIYQFDGLKRTPVEKASVGDIIAFSGIENVTIGNTVCAPGHAEPIPFVKISEPTVEMTFSVNDSPFAGQEGKFVTSRQLRDRLYKETLKDVSLRVQDTESSDSFLVLGRGEMHLSILIETMRREGYEFQVSTPRALIREIDGIKQEPYEELTIDVPEESMGAVMEKMGLRKAELQSMEKAGNRMKMVYIIPTRGLFGYRGEFLTDTKGEGIMNYIFSGYGPLKGEITKRANGCLIAFERGESITYGLFNAQERGTLFIGPGVQVYGGMVVGASPKAEDLVVNVCKKKQATNTRAAGSDEALHLSPPVQMSLEQCLEFIQEDDLLEVTPQNIRIRKKELDHAQRMKQLKRGQK